MYNALNEFINLDCFVQFQNTPIYIYGISYGK